MAANGLDVAYFDSAPAPEPASGARVAILLHGFPDTPHTWRDVAPALSAAGIRVIAPYMRGYAPTSAPVDGDYSAVRLGEDVIALMDALHVRSAVVVGHDWGAFAAYAAASVAPDRVERLVTLAIPHPRALSPAALLKAHHFITFQWRSRAVANLLRDNCALIDDIYRRWSPTWSVPPGELDVVKECIARSAKNVLGYYWSFPRDVVSGAARTVLQRRTSVPALAFFGEKDGALDLSRVERTRDAYTGPYEMVRLPDVGHFIHREAPGIVNDKVRAWLT